MTPRELVVSLDAPDWWQGALKWLDSHLDWQGTVTPPALATTLAVLVAVITYANTRARDNKLKRAEIVQKFAEELSRNDVLFGQFCKIDNNLFTFLDSEEWLKTDGEHALIRLLDHFNGVAHNIERNVLRVEDLRGTTLWYAMQRAFYDPQVQAYLAWVDTFDQANGGTGDAFRFFRGLGKEFKRTVEWSRQNPAPEPSEMASTGEGEPGMAPPLSQ